MRIFTTKAAKKHVNQLLALRAFTLSRASDYGRSQADDLALLVLDLKLRSTEFVVDAGANQGDFALKCRTHWPKARIIAVEPHPRTFEKPILRCKSQAIDTWEGALSSSEGVMELLDHGENEQSQMNSLASSEAVMVSRFAEMAGCEPKTRIPVRVSTLDKVAKDLGITQIDILKTDVEGAEVSVLEGAKQLLRHSSIGLIAVEWSARRTKTAMERTPLRASLPACSHMGITSQPPLLIGHHLSPSTSTTMPSFYR